MTELIGPATAKKPTKSSQGEFVFKTALWIGGLLTVLLLARLGWRLLVAMPQLQDSAMASSAPAIGNSPLTLAMFGLLIGYYITYFAGLLVHHRRFERSQAASSAA